MSLTTFFAIFFIASSWIAEAQTDFELCVISRNEDCNYAYLKDNLPEGKMGWIVQPIDTKCLDGSPFGFQVFPGNTNQLMLWFQGGGVCYNYETCVATPIALRQLFPVKTGIFNMTLEGNPLKNGGWTTVVNNMCTGDMHVGDATRDLTSPDRSKTVTVHHHGYSNTNSVISWIQKQSEFSPENGMVAGGSNSGNAGVQIWANLLVSYGFEKFQLDSFIAFFPLQSNVILQRWNACYVFSKLSISDTIAEQCQNPFLNSISPIFGDFLVNNPLVPAAYIGSTDDYSQILNYALFSNPDYSGDPSELTTDLGIAAATFTSYLWDKLTSYRLCENFSDYIVEGSESSFLNSRDIATDPDYKSPYSRQTMLEFFGNFLNRDMYDGSPDYPEGFPFIINDDDDSSLVPFFDNLYEKTYA